MTNNQVMQQALEALEALDHPDGCKSGYAKDTGEGVWFNEMWPEKCDCGRNAAIESLRSALAQQGEKQPVAFDYQTAADFLNGKTINGELVRRFVSAARWAHDDNRSLRSVIQSLRGELAARDAEIAMLKNALMEAEAAPAAQPDWSLLEATQESLREHMAMVKELQAKLAQQRGPVGEWSSVRFDDLARVTDSHGNTIATLYAKEADEIVKAHTSKLLAGVEMPEACATYECDHDYAENTGLIDYKVFQGDPLVTGMHLYTQDQLQQYAAACAAQAREKALDEAIVDRDTGYKRAAAPAAQPLTDEQIRPAFEVMYRKLYPVSCDMRPNKFERDGGGDYAETVVNVAWQLWKAAHGIGADK